MCFMLPDHTGEEIQLNRFKYRSSVSKSGWTYSVRAVYLEMSVIIILIKVSQGKCMQEDKYAEKKNIKVQGSFWRLSVDIVQGRQNK